MARFDRSTDTPSSQAALIDLGALARRIAVAAAVIAVLAAVVVGWSPPQAGLQAAARAWTGTVVLLLGPTAMALTAASAITGMRRARRRGMTDGRRIGVVPPQLRRR